MEINLNRNEENIDSRCADVGVKVSLNSLSKHLREHPYFPSLLAVHDEFKAIGIDTLTLKSIEYETVTCVNTNASKRCPKDGVSVQV